MVSPRMAALLDSFKDFTEPLRKAEQYMLGSITETFREQGHPQHWAPWKDPEKVLLGRLYRHRGGSYRRLSKENRAIARKLIRGQLGVEEAKKMWKGKGRENAEVGCKSGRRWSNPHRHRHPYAFRHSENSDRGEHKETNQDRAGNRHEC